MDTIIGVLQTTKPVQHYVKEKGMGWEAETMLQFLMRYPNQWVAKSAFYNVNLHNPGRPKSMLVKHGYAIICKKCPTAWMYINDITVAREHMTDKQIKHYFVSKEQLNYVTNNTDPVLFDQS